MKRFILGLTQIVGALVVVLIAFISSLMIVDLMIVDLLSISESIFVYVLLFTLFIVVAYCILYISSKIHHYCFSRFGYRATIVLSALVWVISIYVFFLIASSISVPGASNLDPRIKSELNRARAVADIFYDQHNNSYEGVCADQNIVDAVTASKSYAGLETVEIGDDTVTSSLIQPVCHDTNIGYSIQVPLKYKKGFSFCVDGNGEAITTSFQLTSTGVENGGETDCLTR
ncbi:MAG: hypothetical protein AAB343_04005 [Patescibacteria group bacterium]